jgi:hypothetical protein
MTELLSENAGSTNYYDLSMTSDEMDEIAGSGNWDSHAAGARGAAWGAAGGYLSGGGWKGAAIGGALGYGAGYSEHLAGRNGGGGGWRVICTHFYRKGMFDHDTWRSDLEFTVKHLSPATVRGYQFWAIPYVRLMRRSPLAEKIMFPLARARAIELAYKMGKREKGSLFGKIVRIVGESICFSIGVFVGEQDWQSLYEQKPAS